MKNSKYYWDVTWNRPDLKIQKRFYNQSKALKYFDKAFKWDKWRIFFGYKPCVLYMEMRENAK